MVSILFSCHTLIEGCIIDSFDPSLYNIISITVSSMPSSSSRTSRLAYTFLFIRMARNPLSYGINHEDLYADPQLEQKRLQLITEAAATLDACMMVRFDKRSGNLAVTNQGTIILILVFLLTEYGHC